MFGSNHTPVRRRLIDALNRPIYGFDFFISYGRRDGSHYAIALDQALGDRGFKCFLDHKDMPPGQPLAASTRRGLLASRVLLLVATDSAMSSHYVEEEVRAFSAKARPIVALNLCGTLERTAVDTRVRMFLGDNIWFSEPGEQLPSAPSDFALDALVRSFTFTKNSTRRQRWLLATIIILLLLTVSSLVASYVANRARREAVAQAKTALSRQLAADAQTYSAVQPDLAALLSVEANRVQSTVEARSAVLAAVEERPGLWRTLPGVPEYPFCAAISQSGTTLAIGGLNGTIALWRLPSGEPIGRPFGIPNDGVEKLRFTSNAKMLVSANESSIRVWDLEMSPPGSIALRKKGVNGMDLSPDGKMLIAGGDQGSLSVWNMASPTPRISAELPIPVGGVWDLAFSPDGRIFAVGARNGTIVLWDRESLRPAAPALVAHHGGVTSLSFGPDGKVLVSGYDDGTVLLWGVGAHKSAEMITHRSRVDHVAFSPDGNMIAAGGTGEVLALWNIRTHALLKTLPLTDFDSVNALIFTPDGQFLVAIQEGYGLIWDVRGTHGLSKTLLGHTGKIWALASTLRGDILASGGRDATVIFWRVKDGQRIEPPITFERRWVRSLAFNPDGSKLAVGYGNGAVVFWRTSDHKQVGIPLRLQTEPVTSLIYSRDGRYLASGSSDDSVVLFDLRSSAVVTRYQHGDMVNGVDISPDATLLASSGDDKKIVLWDIKANAQFGPPIEIGTEETEHVHFSPDSRSLAWFNGKQIVLWEIGTPLQQRSYFQGHVDDVNGLEFSADGRLIASATMDHKVVLWDVASQQRFPKPLEGHLDIVWKAVFTGNGKVLASVGNDKTVRLWDIDLRHWISRACDIANRNLTQEEWAQYLSQNTYRPTCPNIQ